jgi:hypothetical protein
VEIPEEDSNAAEVSAVLNDMLDVICCAEDTVDVVGCAEDIVDVSERVIK